MQPASSGGDNHVVEYFDSSFDRVVDATYAAVSSLGMYVEDRYRSGLDQVITVQSGSSVSASSLVITIAQPTVQGVSVSVGADSQSMNPMALENEAAAIFRSITLQLGF
jgi:hypothetical protein